MFSPSLTVPSVKFDVAAHSAAGAGSRAAVKLYVVERFAEQQRAQFSSLAMAQTA